MIRLMSVLMALCVGLVGCKVGTVDVGGRLMPVEETEWQLTELYGEPVIAADPMPFVQLDPKTHRMTGFGGVNRMSSSYKFEGGRLTFGMIAATKMAGPEAAMKIEGEFFTALSQVQTYRIVGSSLEMQNGGKVLARFVAR